MAKSISLPITESAGTPGTGAHFATLEASGIYLTEMASTASKARANLKLATLAAVGECERARRNTRVRVIACVSGHMLVVRYTLDNWYVEVYGCDREGHSASAGQDTTTYDTAVEYARRLAVSNFGGIYWENY